MKKLMKFLLVIIVILAILVFVGLYFYGPNFNIYLFPPSAEKYGQIVLDRMDNGLYAGSETWVETKSAALEKLEDVEDYEDTYPILNEAIKVAGGKHSYLDIPNEERETVEGILLPQVSLEDDILVLTLPPFASGDLEENQEYAYILNDALHNNDYRGVIVNLADNLGGDMGPMISGLSSLIPDGHIISFELRNGMTQEVILGKGKVQGGGTQVNLENTEKISGIHVAVIINDLTASSGEITALAFKGLDNVKYFGQPSAGYTSGNSQMVLYDGAIMQLTTSRLIDRTGTKYENNPIEPDLVTDNPIQAAKEWILAQ